MAATLILHAQTQGTLRCASGSATRQPAGLPGASVTLGRFVATKIKAGVRNAVTLPSISARDKSLLRFRISAECPTLGFSVSFKANVPTRWTV